MSKFLLLASALLLIVGCGPAGPHMVTVTGNVTRDGKPVQGGSISFENPATGYASRSDVGNGTYQVSIPTGEYQVAVEPSMVEVASKNPNSPPMKKYDNSIPAKYHSVRTSELKASVSDSQTSFDFDLKN
ncbi:hypothetical protein [Bremerella cremea]|uniref:hypothetical protein n=1 Tax=Bremerella cremea TaxID=1031537 RepID=UPI0031ED26A9